MANKQCSEKFLKIGLGDNDYDSEMILTCKMVKELILFYNREDFSSLLGFVNNVFTYFVKMSFNMNLQVHKALSCSDDSNYDFADIYDITEKFSAEICDAKDIPISGNCEYYYIQLTGDDKGCYFTV